MSFLFLLTLINFLCIINIFLLLDLFILLLLTINCFYLLYPAHYPMYNKIANKLIKWISKVIPFFNSKFTLNIYKKNGMYCIDSKTLFWVFLKMFYVINSTCFIILSMFLLPFFL